MAPRFGTTEPHKINTDKEITPKIFFQYHAAPPYPANAQAVVDTDRRPPCIGRLYAIEVGTIGGIGNGGSSRMPLQSHSLRSSLELQYHLKQLIYPY